MTVMIAGRVPEGVAQLFIPENKFGAARLDLFIHGGWPGKAGIFAGTCICGIICILHGCRPGLAITGVPSIVAWGDRIGKAPSITCDPSKQQRKDFVYCMFGWEIYP